MNVFMQVWTEGNDVSGTQLFGFKTPKKSGRMAELGQNSRVLSYAECFYFLLCCVSPLAASSASKKTPANSPVTPKSILKRRSSVLQGRRSILLTLLRRYLPSKSYFGRYIESGQTPAARRGRKRLVRINTQTPHRLRARSKKTGAA